MLTVRGPLLFTERIGIPVRKYESKLRDELNQALREFRESPHYLNLAEQYFGKDAASNAAKSKTSDESGLAAFDWKRAVLLMLGALGKTLKVSFEGLALGSIGAVLLCFLMIVPPQWMRVPVLVFVDFVRATPFMIQLFAIYFGLPSIGIVLSAWHAAVLAISIHFSAYLSEILKVAFLSVPQGQHLAARVLGLSRLQSLRHVIAPQMAPLLLAPTLNTAVAMIKDSAIVSVISVHELTLQTQQLISVTFRPIEFYAIAAIMYALITYPMLMIGRGLERHYKTRGLLNGGA